VEVIAVFTIFITNNSHGAACKTKSKISIGRLNSPANNIFIFSHTCGSGKKGARPSVKQAIIKMGNEMLSNQLIMLFSIYYIVCRFLSLLQTNYTRKQAANDMPYRTKKGQPIGCPFLSSFIIATYCLSTMHVDDGSKPRLYQRLLTMRRR